MNGKRAPQVIQIKITLEQIRPPIWRRILVPENTTLADLHKIIQTVFGWYDCHLHEFNYQGDSFSDPDSDDSGELSFFDEKKMTLKKMRLAEGSRINYQYDFGDSWDHLLLVEKILPVEEGMQLPVCLKGKRACPPEDVGGAWGYQNFLDAIADPDHAEHDEYLEWRGGDFDPEAFDLEAINRGLRGSTWIKDDKEEQVSPKPPSKKGRKADPPDEIVLTEADDQIVRDMELRRDTVAFLDYLQENKVTGTPSTGNLPRKAVEGIAVRFVHPPVLESQFGDVVFRFQNEYEVPEVYFIHVLANVSALAVGGQARRWRVTEVGTAFLEMAPFTQVTYLFLAWWILADWRISYQWDVFDDKDYAAFVKTAYKTVQTMPVHRPQPYDDFVRACLAGNPSLKKAGEVNQDRLDHYKPGIECMLVILLEKFGALSVEREQDSKGITRVKTVTKTPLGEKMMLWINPAVQQVEKNIQR